MCFRLFCPITESSESSLTMQHVDIKTESSNTKTNTKEQEYVLYFFVIPCTSLIVEGFIRVQREWTMSLRHACFPLEILRCKFFSLSLFQCSVVVLFIRFCVSLPVHDSRVPSRDLPTSCCSFACCAFHSCPIYRVLSSLPCRLAEDLMKDINSMLSDFSSELDSMFDWASTCILSTTWWKGLLRFPRYNDWEAV